MKMKTKFIIFFVSIIAASSWAAPQQSKPDSVVVKVGEASKIVVTIANKKDAAILKHYNLQALVNDLITKIEQDDTTGQLKPSSEYLSEPTPSETVRETESLEDPWPDRSSEDETDDNVNRSTTYHTSSFRSRRTYHSLSFDVGTNNFLKDGQTFPDASNDAYRVRPFGSWYVGINSVQRTRVANKFYLEWGLGISWYNFKFEDASTILQKDDAGVTFTNDLRGFNYQKSKLTASYVNASFVPVLDFGENRRKPMLFDNSHSDSFRIGAGPYVGYRIGSYSKLVYKDNGNKERERNRDSYYLDNLRYGARLQIGYRDVDLFFNYDLNDIFASGRGPSLNAFSFGLIL